MLSSTAQQAIALAEAVGQPGPPSTAEAARQLAEAADRHQLGAARTELVHRITASSDDFAASLALNLVNRALANKGWPDPFTWKHRRKP